MYPNGGLAGCTPYQFWVTIAGQKSTNSLQLCYTGNFGQVDLRQQGSTTTISDFNVAEGATTGQTYDIVLSKQLDNQASNTVTVSIISSSVACTPSPTSVTFSSSAPYNTAQTVTLAIAHDDIDQPDTNGNLYATCTITHTIASDDDLYKSTSGRTLTTRTQTGCLRSTFGRLTSSAPSVAVGLRLSARRSTSRTTAKCTGTVWTLLHPRLTFSTSKKADPCTLARKHRLKAEEPTNG